MYLIAVDCFMKVFEIDVLTKVTTKENIHYVKKHFTCYAILKVIVFDCGLQFISHNFNVFRKK